MTTIATARQEDKAGPSEDRAQARARRSEKAEKALESGYLRLVCVQPDLDRYDIDEALAQVKRQESR